MALADCWGHWQLAGDWGHWPWQVARGNGPGRWLGAMALAAGGTVLGLRTLTERTSTKSVLRLRRSIGRLDITDSVDRIEEQRITT